MHTLDAFQGCLFEQSIEELCSVIGWYYDCTILSTDKLGVVHNRWLIHDSSDVIQAAYLRTAEHLLEKAKAAIWRELGVAYNQERQGDLLVETNQHSPSQILYHITVLVLARTIVSMQMQIGLAKTVGVEKVVQHADDAVGSLSGVHCLVN